MEAVSIREIMEAVGGHLLGTYDDLSATITHVCRDSRQMEEGALYIPLIGERFDGHAYINAALEAGAAGCFTARERESYLPGKFYIKVDSTQKALRDLARWYKKRFDIPCVAVTGSVGKTTTKDMVAAVLGEKYKVLKTEGNYNNEVGLPLTLLRLNSSHQVAVLEMGMNHFGEIDYLTKIVEPEVALITNVGDSHIENLGSRENILKAKCEIFHGMGENGLAILNGDDELLRGLEGKLPMPVLWCGTGEGCQYRASDISGVDELSCRISTPAHTFSCVIPSPGTHMVYPALMAAAVGEHFGLTQEQIIQGLLHFAPTKMRMNIMHRGDDITILNDTYNANPQSMRAAVDVLAKYHNTHRVAVLGDMLELGALAPALHEGVGEFLGRSGVECLVAVGELAVHIYEAAKAAMVNEIYYCPTKEEAKAVLAQVAQPHSTILVKASRGMAFEELVDELVRLTPEVGESV